MLFGQITIVGVGLIGGSVGLAAKARGVAKRVVGIGRDRVCLHRAVLRGAIDVFNVDFERGIADADLIVVCTPVDQIAAVIREAAFRCGAGTVFTDGGSTKKGIAEAVGKLPPGVHFVPAHPLAGSERNGVENARADLFDGRLTILTPTDGTDPAAVERVEAFWRALGSRVVRMSADEHDRVLATTSHLPHAVAAGVAGVTPPEWLTLSAGGFRDVTRIAGGDPWLWAAIFEANRDAVLAALDRFTDRLAEFRRLLENGDRDGLVDWLADAKRVRDALGT
ncbi:MAG: prephenate dehydrogenase/arogenate dehydrogenase family protein [Gemmataceae bacterium]|nr:prephenate dehydrogenase/arogenate dehydrogenase family protein [Gemmataceae bacterium]